ncbi:probable phosphoglycerate mutase [Paenibacillaceae bacterium GAS479]|nr:probable phosphoglycerate mutase [Paenibacillaceae bacterium GAS479]
MTEIAFIRHGMTNWNREKRAQGQSNIPLNDEGKHQAKLLAERLKNETWDLIISSDLSRASETASIIASSLGMSVQVDQRLREMHKGETEGTTQEERIIKWGEQWESLPLGIEDKDSIINRGTSFVSEIVGKSFGKKVLVVSHGALIGLTVKHFIPELNIAQHFQNTAITSLMHSELGWECTLFNCAKHLN